MEDVWRGIANGPGVGGVGTNGNPHNDGAESFVLAILDGREASRLECGVLKAVGLHRRQDPRGDGFVPHVVERRVEDAVGSHGGDLKEVGSRRGNGEGVGLDIGTPHELGRVAGDAVVPEVHLILGDQVGGDDGAGVRVVPELRVEGLGLAEGGRGGRLSSVLWGSLDRVLALDTVDHEAGHS